MLPSDSRRRDRRGVIAVLVALCLLVILGVLALALDAGGVLDERRRAMACAEAAALSAAIDLMQDNYGGRPNGSLGRATANALAIAADNGYANDGENSIVSVYSPPRSGQFAGKHGYVQVAVRSFSPRKFSSVLGVGALEVKADAVASCKAHPVAGSVLILEPKKDKALELKDHASLTMDGALIVNSTHKKAVKASKKASGKAREFLVSGGLEKNTRRQLQGEIITHAQPTEDPLKGLAEPAVGPHLNINDFKLPGVNGDIYNLLPGTYPGPLRFRHHDVVNLAPGTYYIDGGGLKVEGDATFTGMGVTIFCAPQAGKKDKHDVKFKTKGAVTLTPPAAGPLAGISIFQRPTDKAKVEFSKSSHLNISGTVYAPGAKVRFKKTTSDLGGEAAETGDDDDDDDDDNDDDFDDDGPMTQGSIAAQLICRTLKVDKKSQVHIGGTGINATKPYLGLAE